LNGRGIWLPYSHSLTGLNPAHVLHRTEERAMPIPKTRDIEHQYFIHAPREKVFRAITDPEWLVKWLADRAELESRRGGAYLLGWNNGPTHTGTVLGFKQGSHLSLGWGWPGVELKGTVLKLSVSTMGDGTLFRIEHLGFPRQGKWVDLYGGAEWGWTYFAMNLKSVLEHGHDLRSEFDG
jgi:uncharacterized protein YndB with AHSA1/START domain